MFKNTFITFVLFLGCLKAQTNINPRVIVVNNDAITAFNLFAVTQGDPAVTLALSLPMNTTDTAIRVSSGSQVKVGDVLKIDDEAVTITVKNGRDLTVTRASLGTVAADHTTSSPTTLLKYASLQEFSRVIAIDAIRAIVAKYLPDVNSQISAIEATKKTRTDAAVQ